MQVVLLAASCWEEVEAALSQVRLPAADEEPVCRLDSGLDLAEQVPQVLVPRLKGWRPARAPGKGAPIRVGGRYVVTGGRGALGSACVDYLLAQGAGSVAVLSRSEPRDSDPRAQWMRCDVSEAAPLQEAIDSLRAGGPIHGVLHLAGALADKTLAQQSEQNIRVAFGPKVLPYLMLPQLEPTDFLVLFSSAAAVLGSPGQAAYAAANGALDGLAGLATGACPVTSIQWGPWGEAGGERRRDGGLRSA